MRNFIKIVTFIAGFAIIAAGCTTENDNMNFRKIERFTQNQDGDGNISFSFEQNGRTLNFEGQFGKRAIYLDNVKLWLAFPLTPVDNSPAIRNEDWTFSILPLLNNRENKLNTIILDPGHGGEHPGAKGKFSIEKELNRKIADLTGEILRQRGYTVLYTRADDETVELEPRAESGCFADIFVSIHCNAAPNPDANGIETFSITPKGAPNSNDSDHSMAVNVNDDATGYQHCADSFALAYAIQKKLIESTGANDRGAKRARFHVLYRNSVPAVLVECGFVSNENEEKLLNNPEYQLKIARAIADGIDNYRKGML